ncbi:MAG: hypothetical protein D3926_04410, partial [Desulfobacteraceae bacterium]
APYVHPVISKVRVEPGSQEEMIEAMETHPKLKAAPLILDDFSTGDTTRVIVNLADPGRDSVSAVRQDFNNPAARATLTTDVASAQDRVINAVNTKDIQITNRFIYVFGFSAEVTVEGLAALINHPEVATINEDGIRHPHLAQGIPLINASTVRSSYNGQGMSIAICDTGVDYTHPRLGGGGFPNTKVIGGTDTGENDADPMDEQGHGTSCAGIAAGNLGTSGDYIGGVAYNAKIYAVKMSRTDIDHSAYDSDMVQAWEWCVTHQNDNVNYPIKIISTSFGGGYYTSEASCDSYNASMTTAAANAKAAGMTLFVSTGNDGFCDGTGWPGGISHVVGVGAVYDANIGRHPETGFVGCISLNSCVGFTAGCGCSSGNCYIDYTTAADQVTTYSSSASFMELFGPSNDTYTTALGGGFRDDFGGTSAACPYAAGAAAALQSAAKGETGSFLTPAQVQSILESTGDSITDPKASPAVTKPRVNLGKAVDALVSDNLLFFWAHSIHTTSPVWTEVSTGESNAKCGLSSTWNPNSPTFWVIWLSYIASQGSSEQVKAVRIHGFTGFPEIIQTNSNYTGWKETTSISAYADTVICAYEQAVSRSDYGIRYDVSYNAGSSWNYGTWDPDPGNDLKFPSVTCRGGQGSAITYIEATPYGSFDHVWFRYRDHYSSGMWSAEVAQINDKDVGNAYPVYIQWFPPLRGKTYAYGVTYLSWDEASGVPYFDRSDGGVPYPVGAIDLLLLDE